MSVSQSYQENGFVSAVSLFTAAEAAEHRAQLEKVEAQFGPQHYTSKMHTLLDFAAKAATAPQVLDVVEQILGPDIMLFDVTYIIKEPQSASHVSWHQDLTYWGLSNDEQVSMWLALSPASPVSGCMRMVPGSHKEGRLEHQDTDDETNVLFRGQSVEGVAEEKAVMCPLEPGQASFHHGWTLHASMPNRSDDRRIGFNVQYINPSARQTLHDADTALLVRGKDAFNHYQPDTLATGVMDDAAVKIHADLERRRKEVWAQA